MDLSLVTEAKWYPHPNHPEVSFEVESLDEASKMQYFAELQKYTTAQALKDPDTGEILFTDEKDGTRRAVTVERTNLPFDSIVQFLLKVIKNWKGLEDKGSVHAINAETMKLLFKKKLYVTQKDADDVLDKDGNKTGKKKDKVTPCWSWIQSLAMAEESDLDPTVKL